MRVRNIALCAAVALLAAACGSRLSDDKLAGGAGTGAGGPGVTASSGTAAGGNTKGVTKGSGGPKIGTLPLPCGKAPAGKAPTGSPDTGVTADSIKIAVISDKSGQIKVPTGSVEESMQAFTDFCNSYGGINGRKLDLLKIDSKLFSHLEATTAACNAKVFAIVGAGSVTDNQGAQKMVDCGLVEVPAYTATAPKAMSDNLVQPVPNPTNRFNVGAPRYVAKQHPKAIKKAGILWGDVEVAATQARRIVEAYEKQGFKFIYKKKTGLLPADYTAEAKEMKDQGVEYITQVDTLTNTVKLLRDMKLQDYKPEVIDLGAQYYDPLLPATDGSEGAIVQLNTVPFEAASDSPALQAYLDAYAKVGTKVRPTTLGVQSFDAGLLFATAAKAVGNDLTRDKLLAALHKINKWDGGGLQYPSNPGANEVNDCYKYVVVKGGKFVPLEPTKPAAFHCNPKDRIDLTGDYGTGAKRKGS
ncbi:MAG: amino acid/amide transporter substrate-binding protein family [Acidimicrobiales bacterium]|nr:amino acid/amide transporter substrate-binding protein family [Acidimicrobiales bacterium]